ncbi:unnamed protein product [Echinostoma caproni]|uniref:Phospholipid scramblase n=1 Tax=Echinostoma caproni TaxID=27848 RepID=A0A183ATV7_9TREM|nr:unnamed protein product [Echinostoma caproni]
MDHPVTGLVISDHETEKTDTLFVNEYIEWHRCNDMRPERPNKKRDKLSVLRMTEATSRLNVFVSPRYFFSDSFIYLFIILPYSGTSNQVMSADGGAEIGRITKQWSNLLQEMFTDADNFGVSFPLDLDVRVKATLIGAVFLIVSFENHRRRHDD